MPLFGAFYVYICQWSRWVLVFLEVKIKLQNREQKSMKKVLLIGLAVLWKLSVFAQAAASYQGDSWKEVLRNKQGTVTSLWNGIDPFVFKASDGRLMGVEYEVMEAFVRFTEKKYGVKLAVNWVENPDFQQMIAAIKNSKQAGVFAWGYVSFTAERAKFLQFTPPYMPDLNVLVTHANQALYKSPEAFLDGAKKMHSFAMDNTTMAEDLAKLRSRIPQVATTFKNNDYEIAEAISQDEKAFGYLPLSIYIVALQRGLKVKRQPVWAIKRPGFAGIYPQKSDWKVPVDAYFESADFQRDFEQIARKYLGAHMWKLVFLNVMNDSMRNQNDLELLQIEKDLFAARVIEAAQESEFQRDVRNILLLTGVFALVLMLVFYLRYRSKKQYSEVLRTQNELILAQKSEIERINRDLQLRVLQSQTTPYFVFNALHTFRYFVSLNERKSTLAYLTALSECMNSLSQQSETTFCTVEDECQLLTQCLQLEKIRYADKFGFEVQYDQAVKDWQIPTLLIYPLIETALHRGILVRKDNDGFLQVGFDYKNGYIVGSIEVNAPTGEPLLGINNKSETDNASLNLMWQRMELYNAAQAGTITVSTSVPNRYEIRYRVLKS